MSSEGWVFMAGSWVVILALFAYSMFRTLTSKDDDKTDGQAPKD